MIVGIIGAMEKEIIILRERMDITRVEEKASLTFYIGKLKDRNIVLVRSGIGKVNAALCTQILIDIFNVDVVINTGVAGALHPDLDVGDIVVSTDSLQHDIDASAFGDPRGVVPGLKESIFVADQKLLDIIDEITIEGHKILKGRVLTGDQGVASSEIKHFLVENFEGYCVEMEGGAIAHVCYLNQIPFLIIRAISDKADEEVEINYNEFVEFAAKNSSDMLESILERL